MLLNELFHNTSYDYALFSEAAKSDVESRIFMKTVRGAEVPHITCAIRKKEIKLTPEEAVRQLFIHKLLNEYMYPASRIELETAIHFGREVKRADIAIMDKDRPMIPYIIIELKKPKLTDGKDQLKSYCNATGAPIGVWTNGEQISCYNRKDPNFFEEISDIPKANQKLSDIINERFTYHTETPWTPSREMTASEQRWYNELQDILKTNSVLWFLDFVYRLRNALFHEIIDPLDEEWQIIFKNAYLVLKEIVDLNILVIESTPAEPQEEKEPAAPV